MQLYRVIQPVSDIGRAAAFYEALLGMPGESISPGRHYFRCGSTILACYDAQADGDGDVREHVPGHNQYLYFSVDDLGATRARLVEAGGTALTEIDTMPWGESLFYALDPQGSRLCFVQSDTLFTG